MLYTRIHKSILRKNETKLISIRQRLLVYQTKMGWRCEACKKNYVKDSPNDIERHCRTQTHLRMSDPNRKTRDHSKCMTVEEECRNFFNDTNTIYHFPGIEGGFELVCHLPREKKTDTYLLVQNVDTGELVKIGIQTKSGNGYNYENWLSKDKFVCIAPRIREVVEKYDIPKLKKIQYIKHKNKKGNSNCLIRGTSLIIGTNGDVEVEDLDMKKMFVLGKTPSYDYLFYDVREYGKPFDITKMQFVDDEFIRSKRMFYNFRNIYNSSGNRNLGILESGGSWLTDEEIKYINEQSELVE